MMKLVLATASAYVACSAWGMTLQEARKVLPELAGLNDQTALNVIHSEYYPDMDKAELAKRLGVEWVPPKAPQKLGIIDKWRYESCQKEATQAATSQGVNIGMRLCREKFSQ